MGPNSEMSLEDIDETKLSLCSAEQLMTLQISPMLLFILAVNILSGIMILIAQIYIFYQLHFRRTVSRYIDECGQAFQNALEMTHLVRMPIAGVLVMAEVAGISPQEIVYEYGKDSMERRALVYSLFGRNKVVERFVNWPDGKFIRHGYEGEEHLLENAAKLKKT